MHVGTCGWQYRHWRGVFYPDDVPVRRWLEWYASRFRCLEIDGTFYKLPSAQTFAQWAGQVPDGFTFALKASRYLTHYLRLRDPAEPVARLVERIRALDDRLGPVLLQLPPDLTVELDRLRATLAQFPPDIRVAVEPRHPSWFVDDVRAALEEAGAAWCLADRHSRPVGPVWRSASWTYLRLHGGRGLPPSGYGRQSLRNWVDRLRAQWGPAADAYVFFNNDAHGCAPRDAATFSRLWHAAAVTRRA